MAARRRLPPLTKGPEIPLSKGLLLLKELHRESEELSQKGANWDRIEAWYTCVEKALKQTFGEDSGHLCTWWGNTTIMVVGLWDEGQSEDCGELKTFLERRQALAAIIEAGEGELRRETLISESGTSNFLNNSKPELDVDKVFIVHGRNESLRESCARFVERLGLTPIILHERPNGGMTLLEKFEKHALTGYAIVLLTGDDLGCLASEEHGQLKARARQNVIYELGFFAGAIGRARVCALYESGVELPSDLGGLAVVETDPAGGWQFKIARELKAAGLAVDLNKLA